MKISTYECPKCKDKIFSRAHHDWRECSCGEIFVDGGFEYIRVGYITEPPPMIEVEIDVTKKKLYDDWNNRTDKYGIIKGE